ncbi:MAG: hypothetical protein K2V38_08860 [Gemmataceae bacterium]|nr:hypothetical protein [Gemmataceae bacterium]
MTPLCLLTLCAVGADPAPYPYPSSPPLTPPYVAERRVPFFLKPVERRMREKVSQLAFPGAGRPAPGGSYLWEPSYTEDHVLRGAPRAYTPQPGDIVLSADGSVFWKLMHNLAGTSHPTHSMIVFRMPDGTPGILEGGPHDTLKCRVLEALPHMLSYEAEGRVWVRRRACPLTAEQSARLTEFALATNERDFGIRRLAQQLTPFRTRGPIRTAFVGKPHGIDHDSYFCSELVCEACVYAGLMDFATTRPSATYPRDLFMDRSLNPYLNKHLKLAPAWDPPARWTSSPTGVSTPGAERR